MEVVTERVTNVKTEVLTGVGVAERVVGVAGEIAGKIVAVVNVTEDCYGVYYYLLF